MRKLIINADDLGVTEQRSHGIFLCTAFGTVTSASLMVNGYGSTLAARHAREKNVPVGIHFNFTEGVPISKPGDVFSLLTPDGFFIDRESLLRKLSIGEIQKDHILREARAQTEWCIEHYGMPTHADSHHHLHVHPFIAPILTQIFDRYGISFVRIPSEPLPPFGFEIPKEKIQHLTSIITWTEESKKLFAAHGMKFVDHFRGLALSGNASARNLRHILGRLPEGTTELMVHPGSPNAIGDAFEVHPQRQTELNMLLSDELKKELKERNIELCSYRELF